MLLSLGVRRWPVCVPGSGTAERGGTAGQSSDVAKFYRERHVRHHLHTDKDGGILTLTGGNPAGHKQIKHGCSQRPGIYLCICAFVCFPFSGRASRPEAK